MRAPVAWGVGVLLLAGTWAVAAVTPDGEQRATDPFIVTTEVGVPAEAGRLAVEVTDVVIADRVSAGAWAAEGTWLVVDVTAWAVGTDVNASLGAVYLRVGEQEFRASERPAGTDPGASLYRAPLFVDLPQSGSVAFELPADVVDQPAILRFAAGPAYPDLPADTQYAGDAILDVPLDLQAVPRITDAELEPTEWAKP